MIVSGAVFVGIILLQILYLLFVTKAYPKTDSFNLLTVAMEAAREGKLVLQNETGYFAGYTNNYPFAIFLYGFFRLMLFLGIDHLWNAIIVLNVIMIDLAILITYFLVRKLRGKRQAAIAMFLIAFCPTTYVWLTFTYTNTFNLPFCMLLLYMAICYQKREGKVVNTGYILLMGMVAGIGYLVRATMIIPIIAVSIYFVFSLYNQYEGKDRWKNLVRVLGIFLLCFFIITKSFAGYERRFLKDPTMSARLPITHWIMMGLGNDGGFNYDDLAYTQHFVSYEEKQAKTKEKIVERIKTTNLVGLAQRKITRVWADGSDESFTYNQRDTGERSLHRYVNDNRNVLVAIYVQIFRVLTIVGILLAVWHMLRRKVLLQEFLLALSMFGAIVFFLIWEANIKYSISFIFMMLILFEFGLEDTITCLEKFSFSRRVSMRAAAVSIAFLLLIMNLGIMLIKMDHFTNQKATFKNYISNGSRRGDTYYKDGAIRDRVFTQTFLTNQSFNRLRLIGKKLKGGDESTVYTLRLLDSNGAELEKQTFTKKKVRSNGKIEFDCNVGKVKKKQTYLVEITKTAGEKDSIQFGTKHAQEFDYIQNGVFSINGEEQNLDLFVEIFDEIEETYMSKSSYFIKCGLILLLQVGICGSFGILYQNSKRIKKRNET
ncbi:membrane protein [Lachnospiraceae bacterium KM106-2]|nr:membrane protein [Lachnospiraceae bacterium KM106-2]